MNFQTALTISKSSLKGNRMMNLHFNQTLAEAYKYQTQKIRVMSEDWMGNNGYCPNCCTPVAKVPNNKPVKDFFCPSCNEQFELKSKRGLSAGKTIPDGAYHTMLERLQAEDNPNFFFLAYRKSDYSVQQLVLVPKHFVTAEMIIPRRKPVTSGGRKPYLMCTMNIGSLPESGKIKLIDKACPIAPDTVQKQWQTHLFMRQQKTEKKGWLLAVMRCLDKLPEQFDLKQVYAFETELQKQFQHNQHIQAKIRQQLQILRDQNIIEFSARGKYRKIG